MNSDVLKTRFARLYGFLRNLKGFMFKQIKRSTFIIGIAVCGALVLADRFAFYASKSALGWNRFRLLYDISNEKSAFLDDYRARIWEHGGGYVPDPVAHFLVNRLESSDDAREISAIVRFESLQAGGREAPALFTLSDRARRRVAQTVLSDWKSYPDTSAQGGFILIEGLRQNTYVGKANVILHHSKWANSQEKLAPVAALFDKWNRQNASVPFTQRPNPLAGSEYEIVAP